MPAYITREQFERNQVQLRANRPTHLGPVRAGSALLSGLLVCGRCGLRMTAVYNNDGHAARYACTGQNSSYGAPFCQSLKAAPVYGQVTSLILRALEPAALEASLAVAADLQAERAALERQWQQRLERAQYQVDQARRRYASTEPENRLVARTLERDWEAALSEQVRLNADYERVRRERQQAPTPAELTAIRQLTTDLPALWHAPTADRLQLGPGWPSTQPHGQCWRQRSEVGHRRCRHDCKVEGDPGNAAALAPPAAPCC